MAKHILLEAYSFAPSSSPGAATVTLTGKALRREQVILITNVTSNKVYYNFADSALTFAAFTATNTLNVESTTMTLSTSTTGASSSDRLSIIIEDVYETFQPAETYMDPVGKFRISQPQSLIDTDFEYGVQPTKWETLNLMNNRPSAFFDSTAPITFTGISGNGTRLVTITLASTSGIDATTPIFIQDTADPNANGWYLPQTVVVNTSITYYARANVTNGSIYDQTKTYLFVGTFYTGAGIAISTGSAAAMTFPGGATTTTIYCNTINNHGLSVGDAIYVVNVTGATGNAGTANPNGGYIVKSTPTTSQFTFDAAQQPVGGSLICAYNSTGATVNITADSSGRVISVSTGSTFGSNYKLGDIVSVTGGNGNCFLRVNNVISGSPNSWQIYSTGTGYTPGLTSNAGTTFQYSANMLYARPWGNAIHRPFDGGVYFTAGAPYHGNQLIRQTRRYFRYQSGKGIQFSTGSCMTSPFILDSLTWSGGLITVTTKFPHNMFNGARIKIQFADQPGYNGTWVINAAPTDTTFNIVYAPTLTSPATGGYQVQPYQWDGAYIRLGMFDQQNGFFWEYDGSVLSANKKGATAQLAGYISNLGNGAYTCTGVNTQWASQLNTGDFIVIRGSSHTVISIESNTSMTIYPDYRGFSIVPPTQCIISRIDRVKVPQSQFNIDRVDGTGNSLYNWDVTRMQMWYIDYTWYGAGAIRFGFKNSRGEIFYVHRMAHANKETEAYMRSGNLPARYEVSTIAPYTKTTQTLLNTDTTLYVASTDGFPTTGTAVVSAPGNANAVIEYIGYAGKTSTTLTGLTRAKQDLAGPLGLTGGAGTSTAATFSFSPTAQTGVTIFSPQCSNTISHWGSSVMMDGRFDNDKGLVFVAGQQTTYTNLTVGTQYPLLSIRIAPSVDSGITGAYGARELVNRMQLTLVQMDAFTSGTNMSFLVTLRLNGYFTTGTPSFQPAGGSSLAQYVAHTSTDRISGGEPIFGFWTSTPGVTSQDLSAVRDLGNSILGGGTSNLASTTGTNRYPDGPDILTIVCQPFVSSFNTINARISWTEAQA
jgi:hypothetical protein